MIELFAFTIGLLGVFVCVMDWRKGIFICILAGFLQDPLRKVIEGEPVALTVLVAVFVGVSFLGAKTRGKNLSLRDVPVWQAGLKWPLQWFIALVVVQSMAALLRTGSVVVSGIGLLAYLSPIPALLLSYYSCRDGKDIIKFMKVYLVVCALMISGIYLSYAGFDWKILQQVGEGLIAFAPTGEKLKLHTGFLRAPEIAAWHAGTAICFTIILFLAMRRKMSFGWFSGLLILFFFGAIILTGRRKILMETVLFISFYGFLLAYFGRGAAKLATFLLLIGITVAVIGNSYLFKDEIATGFRPYFLRGASVKQGGGERIYDMTIGSFKWVIEKNGIFGSGAGTGSQGAQHFEGTSDTIVGGSAEGGVGKLLAELGIPGLILFLWIIIMLARYFWKSMVRVKDDPFQSRLLYGMVSLLIANMIVFATAHQVFGDPFVLLILGWILGFVFAIPMVKELNDRGPYVNVFGKGTLLKSLSPVSAGIKHKRP